MDLDRSEDSDVEMAIPEGGDLTNSISQLVDLPSDRVQKLDLLKFQEMATKPNQQSSNYPQLHFLIKPHIDSFNSIFSAGLLDSSIQNLEPREVVDIEGNRLRFWIEDVRVSKPMLSEKEHRSLDRALYPSECRERGVSYRGKMSAKFMFSVNGGQVRSEVKALGALPIMAKSSRCNLFEMSPAELISKREDPRGTRWIFYC